MKQELLLWRHGCASSRWWPRACLGLLGLGVMLPALIGCSKSQGPASPKTATVEEHAHHHNESGAGHDHDVEDKPPASLSEAVKEVASLRDRIRAAFSKNDLKEADHYVHEIGHAFEHIGALVKKEALSEQQRKEASDAVEKLFESFGAVDDKLHDKAGKSYAEVEEQVDKAVSTLESLVPKQEK